jgi:hypothetical protein
MAAGFLTTAQLKTRNQTLDRMDRGGKRQFSSRVGIDIEVQGVTVMAEHLDAARAIVTQIAPQIVAVSAVLGISYARELVPWDTGATNWSIHADPVKSSPGGAFWTDYGPTTYYARWLEWGTIRMAPRPFMIPSADLVAPAFTLAMMELASVVDKHTGSSLNSPGRAGNILSDPGIRSTFTGLRSFLYSGSKYLGDVAIIGGADFINPVRSQMLQLARVLGDVNASMKGALNTRIRTRLSGRATARIVGFGRASFFGSGIYSANVATGAGSRVYQRLAGSISGSALTGLNFR